MALRSWRGRRGRRARAARRGGAVGGARLRSISSPYGSRPASRRRGAPRWPWMVSRSQQTDAPPPTSSPGLADGAYGPRLCSGEHRYTLQVSCARRGAASVWIGFADAGGADANHDGTVDRAEFTAYGRAMVSVGAALARSGAGSADAVEGATIAVVVDLAARTFKWRVEDGGANRPPIEDDGGWVDGGAQLPAQVRLWVLLGGDVGDAVVLSGYESLEGPTRSWRCQTATGSVRPVPFSAGRRRRRPRERRRCVAVWNSILRDRAAACKSAPLRRSSLRHAFADEGFNISKYSALLNRLVADGLETRRVYRSAAEFGAAVSAAAESARRSCARSRRRG